MAGVVEDFYRRVCRYVSVCRLGIVQLVISLYRLSTFHLWWLSEADEVKREDGDDGDDVPDDRRRVGQIPPRRHVVHHFRIEVAPQAQLVKEADDVGENKGGKQDRQTLHLQLQLALKVLADCVDQDQVTHDEAN